MLSTIVVGFSLLCFLSAVFAENHKVSLIAAGLALWLFADDFLYHMFQL